MPVLVIAAAYSHRHTPGGWFFVEKDLNLEHDVYPGIRATHGIYMFQSYLTERKGTERTEMASTLFFVPRDLCAVWSLRAGPSFDSG